jgi:hypothetical protein
MTRVFISHSSLDRDFVVSRLKQPLEEEGVTAWCSSTDIKTAVNWEHEIRAALAKSDWFLVVLSPDAQRSEWVQAETHWAVEHLPGRLIPIMVRTCEPVDVHLRLGTLQFLDFRADKDAGFGRLMGVIHAAGRGNALLDSAVSAGDADRTTRYVIARRASMLARIELQDGPSYQEQVAIQNSLTIGRSQGADLRVEDECVSRRHARIDVVSIGRDVSLTVMDLGSANGTFVNGELIQAPRRIKAGDVVSLGKCHLYLEKIE